MHRIFIVLTLLFGLSACTDATRDLAQPVEPIGDFQIGHIGVVAPNLQKLLVSRTATEDEWITAMSDALSARFDRFSGGKYYHLGVSVEAYSLPPPIIPGKSALALNVTLWDDAAQAKMNEPPKQINVIRVVETRLASTKETQIAWLVAEAAKEVETWMREMQESDGWFVGADPDLPAVSSAPDDPEDAPETGAVDSVRVIVPESVLAATRVATQDASTGE